MYVYPLLFLLCLCTSCFSSVLKEEGKGGKVTEKKLGGTYGKGGAPSYNFPSKGGAPTADRIPGIMPEKRPERMPDKTTEMPEKSHLRPSEMGIPVGEALDPPLCPPPPVTRSYGICYLEKCTSHHDCDKGSACCFNGCIRACTEPLPRPAAFDWIEDTSKVLPILGPDFEDPPQPFFPVPFKDESPRYAAAEAGEELVHLPGGCYVSASRYQKLKEFMKAPSIKECRCDDGEVVCDIRTEKT